jgi:hypothetical protein
MSNYRSTMSTEAFRAAVETMRRQRDIERQERIEREEQASREVCERRLRERRAPVLEYAI